MISLFMVYLFLLFMSGFSSLCDSSLLGLMVNSTGPVMGYGVLTLFGDGFKLFSKNPWLSFIFMTFSFLIYGLETMPLGIIYISSDTCIILISFLGFSGVTLLIASFYFHSGYSTLGKYSTQTQILMGEGMFSLFFYLMLFCTNWDSLFSGEQDFFNSFSFYTPYMLVLSFFLILLGESHPWDIPESESDLGGGLGVSFSGIFFMLFAVLEYSWVLYFIMLCYISKWTLSSHLLVLFFLSGLLPSFSYKMFLYQIWFYFPVMIETWLIFSLISMFLEFVFL